MKHAVAEGEIEGPVRLVAVPVRKADLRRGVSRPRDLQEALRLLDAEDPPRAEQFPQQRRRGPVPAAVVQDGGGRRPERAQAARQPLDPAAGEVPGILAGDREPAVQDLVVVQPVRIERGGRFRGSVAGHRRLIPRMLRKKLDNIVWNPSAVSVTPGITQRIVRL